jgi:adenylate cyclase
VDPHYPPVYLSFLGLAQFGLEQYGQAAESLAKATSLNPEDAAGFLLLGASYGHLGRKEEAQSALVAYNTLVALRGSPSITATFAWGTWGFKKREDRDRLFDGLLQAGVPERMKSQ